MFFTVYNHNHSTSTNCCLVRHGVYTHGQAANNGNIPLCNSAR